ncbi:MAG TPA: hypothetical protein VFG76_07535 [Candidatus Polarisedimenticolia bacterium]|nr:hypothetical protein [Candidatus Polarisedimenticolia bacterium]
MNAIRLLVTTLLLFLLLFLCPPAAAEPEPPDPPPAPDSCEGRDGEIAPAGCSCEQGCGWKGTCCSDVNQYRTTANQEIGRAYVNLLAPVTVQIGGKGNQGQVRRDTSFVADNDPAVIGLMSVELADIDSQGEHSRCKSWCDAGGVCSVEAYVDYDDNKAKCSAGGLHFPSASAWPNVETTTRHATDGGIIYEGMINHPTECLGGTSTDSIPVLKSVLIEDTDASNERAGCRIDYLGNTCGWRLVADADDDSDSGCSASLLKLSHGMLPAGTFDAAAESWTINGSGFGNPALTEVKEHKFRSRHEVPMKNAGDHVCFLNEIEVRDLDDGYEKGTCEILDKNGTWTLVAQVSGWEGDLDADVLCQARCASLPTGGTTAAQRAWPDRPATIVDALGGKAHLYQGGSAYDRPLIFLEGFDPANKLGPTSYMKKAGDLFFGMLAAEFDIWMLDHEDGGQGVTLSAMEAAKTIDLAYRHLGWNTNPAFVGKKIPVIGVSMGGVSGRLALSTWQDGIYNSCPFSPVNPECIGGLTTQPPVSVFLSLSSPQLGANIAKSIQTLVQDFGDYHDLGESSRALNCPAAVNMLNERIDPGCDHAVTQWCNSPAGIGNIFGAHGDHTLKDSPTIDVRGGEVTTIETYAGNQFTVVDNCWLDDSGCVQRSGPGTGSGCVQWATPKSAFYASMNARGPRGNGFPNLVTIGVASSGWLPQGRDNMSPAASYGTTPFTTGTELGSLDFDDEGHLGFCDRDTIVRGYLTASDLVPGDLSERAITDLEVDGGSTVTSVLMQNFPFMHIPTTSALACPNATTQQACAAENAAGARFSHVYSSASSPGSSANKNMTHADPDKSLGYLILAHLWDGSIGADADGYIGANNPYRLPAASHITVLDCDDSDRNVTTSDSETCTFVAGNCSTTGIKTCSNGTWGSCAPPSEVCIDGIDNNCDGLVDEGCYGVSATYSFVYTPVNVLQTYGKAVLVARRPMRVIVRDANNQPLPAGVPVELDFGTSNALVLNAQQPAGVTVDCARRKLTSLTNSFSRVDFSVRFGGVADPNYGVNTLVKVRAGGILLRNDLQAMSPDMNMDGIVDGADEDIFMIGYHGDNGCVNVQECPQTDFDLDLVNYQDDGDYFILAGQEEYGSPPPLCP